MDLHEAQINGPYFWSSNGELKPEIRKFKL